MRIGKVRKLSEEEIQERLARYAKHPDTRIRDEIVLQYCNLVESIARRFVGACEPLEDLVQEGYIGLIDSVDKYDAGKGVKFSTYATHFIIGGIKHYLRDKGKIIKEPAWLQELNQKVSRVMESLNQKLGRTPTEKEIADEMHMPEKTVRELLTTREVFKVSSLDGDKDDNPNTRDTEKIKDEKLVTFQLPVEDKLVLGTAFERLKEIEREVIHKHYYKDLNQTEIARNLGISCNYVSHILRNGTKKLKKILATDEIRDTQMQRANVSRRQEPRKTPVDTFGVLDPVTGLYNGVYYVERLDEEISRAFRQDHDMAVMVLQVYLPDDLDERVKMIRMDDVVYRVASQIRESVRKMDVLARIDDNHFGLILPHTSDQAAVVAERVREVVGSVKIDTGRGNSKAAAGVKIGIAQYPRDGRNSRELLGKAAAEIGVCIEELLLHGKQGYQKAA